MTQQRSSMRAMDSMKSVFRKDTTQKLCPKMLGYSNASSASQIEWLYKIELHIMEWLMAKGTTVSDIILRCI